MSGEEPIYGLILAGGRSTRFGREKAVALLRGEPLIAWAARALGPPVARIAISAPEDCGAAAYARANQLPVLPDGGVMARGPLAGVLEGLQWAEREGAAWLATLPCDAPLAPPDLVARLAGHRTCGGAVVRTPDGLQPLCALWPVSAIGLLERQPEHPPVRAALKTLGAAEVMFEDATALANLNTPEALAGAEARLAGAPP